MVSLRFFLALSLVLLLSPSSGAQVCGTFQPVASPSPDAVNGLRHVTSLSPTDAWALGSTGTPGSPLLLHWDGSAWTEASVPAAFGGVMPTARGRTDNGDLWVAAQRGTSPSESRIVLARARNGAFDRVDEVQLAPQTTAPNAPRTGTPVDIDGASADDVWVGLQALGNGDATGTLISSVLHFDGSAWTETILPRPSTVRSQLEAIDVVAPNDVWAVGFGRSVGSAVFPEVYHYDGGSWALVETPLSNMPQTYLRDVSGSGPDDVWAVGYINFEVPVYLHWDGSAWTRVSGPSTTDAPMAQVLSVGPNDAWATPYSLSGATAYAHWDGTSWTEVSDPVIPGATSVARGLGLSANGPCDIWSVGTYLANGQSYTLIERLQPGPVGPVARFRAEPEVGCAPASVAFTNGSFADDSAEWTFGDGSTSSLRSPLHVYSAVGSYTVHLMAANAAGSRQATRRIDLVEPCDGRAFPLGDQPLVGTSSGSYRATIQRDGLYQRLDESFSPDNASILDHRWTLRLPPSPGPYSFVFEGHATIDDDGEDFVFEYSTDGEAFTPFLSVRSTGTTGNQYVAEWPQSLSGETVTLRVRDSDRTPGNDYSASLYIDRIYVSATPIAQPSVYVESVIVDRSETPPFTVGRAHVVVRRSDGGPAAFAQVSGSFAGASAEPTFGQTMGDGSAVLMSSLVTEPADAWCFSVTDVVLAGWAYDASLNVQQSGCEGGGLVSTREDVPEALGLTAFPNPTRGAATIRYHLVTATDVRVDVYDALGRHVATLVDATEAAGVHDVVWSATSMPSGVYVVRIVHGAAMQQQRLTVLQ
jgi:PKD repeat protein